MFFTPRKMFFCGTQNGFSMAFLRKKKKKKVTFVFKSLSVVAVLKRMNLDAYIFNDDVM